MHAACSKVVKSWDIPVPSLCCKTDRSRAYGGTGEVKNWSNDHFAQKLCSRFLHRQKRYQQSVLKYFLCYSRRGCIGWEAEMEGEANIWQEQVTLRPWAPVHTGECTRATTKIHPWAAVKSPSYTAGSLCHQLCAWHRPESSTSHFSRGIPCIPDSQASRHLQAAQSTYKFTSRGQNS